MNNLEYLLSELDNPINGIKSLIEIFTENFEDSCYLFRKNNDYQTYSELKGLLFLLASGVNEINNILSEYQKKVEDYYEERRTKKTLDWESFLYFV